MTAATAASLEHAKQKQQKQQKHGMLMIVKKHSAGENDGWFDCDTGGERPSSKRSTFSSVGLESLIYIYNRIYALNTLVYTKA